MSDMDFGDSKPLGSKFMADREQPEHQTRESFDLDDLSIKKRTLAITWTLAWIPLIYGITYLSQFNQWHIKATIFIGVIFFIASMAGGIIAITLKSSIFGRAWRSKKSLIAGCPSSIKI